LDIICSSKLTVFLEQHSREAAVHFSDQIMSAYKYSSIFSRQMEAIGYIAAATISEHSDRYIPFGCRTGENMASLRTLLPPSPV